MINCQVNALYLNKRQQTPREPTPNGEISVLRPPTKSDLAVNVEAETKLKTKHRLEELQAAIQKSVSDDKTTRCLLGLSVDSGFLLKVISKYLLKIVTFSPVCFLSDTDA